MEVIKGHTPTPRETKKPLPYLIIIGGRSMAGKTTLSKLLSSCNDFIYYSTDKFTTDLKTPIKELNDKVRQKGSVAAHQIPTFQPIVFKHQDAFIEYCYTTITENPSSTIIEGVYFNDESFLNKFKSKFKGKYKIWVIKPDN